MSKPPEKIEITFEREELREKLVGLIFDTARDAFGRGFLVGVSSALFAYGVILIIAIL